MQKKYKVFIIAGEESGDFLGSRIAQELKKIIPNLELYGIGGKKMESENVNLIENISNLSVVGLFEVFSHLYYILKTIKKVKNFLVKNKPDFVILIDFPDFNFRIAKFSKKIGLKVYYFVSPQVWAWRRGRVKFLKKYVDKMYVIFPFEEDFYKEYGINVKFVGHPLTEKIKPVLNFEENTIGILPGSRKIEVKRHLPIIVSAVNLLNKKFKNLKFLLPVAENIDKSIIEGFVKTVPNIEIYKGKSLEVIKKSKIIISTSGTATLESALMGRPVIIIYRVNFFSYIIGRLLIKVPYIGMPNLLLGEKVNPELIQYNLTPFNIYLETVKFLKNKEKYNFVVKKNLSLYPLLYKEEIFSFVKDFLS